MNLSGFGELIGGIAAGASAAFGAVKLALINPLERRIDDVEEEVEDVEQVAEDAQSTAESNEDVLLGDDDDPNYSGVAQDVSEIKDTVDHLEEVLEEVRDK